MHQLPLQTQIDSDWQENIKSRTQVNASLKEQSPGSDRKWQEERLGW